MKDSKNKLKKSSSESKILGTKTVPPMPKDKRTKEYKEWYKKYGEIDKKDKKAKSKKNQSIKQKKETLDIPPMPKDKRTKEYKEWHKKYGEIDKKDEKAKLKKNQTQKEGSKIDKNIKLKDLVILFTTKVESDDWLLEKKFIEEIKKKIELALKDEFDKEKKKFDKNKKSDEKFTYKSDSKILFQKSLKTFSSKKRKYYSEIGTIQKQNL